jgi:hypothetical protein
LTIEVDVIDIAREPRIAAVARPHIPPELAELENLKQKLAEQGRNLDDEEEWSEERKEYERVGPLVPGWEYGGFLNPGPDRACLLLGGVPGDKERLCGIYLTRPNCCVAMQAGGNQCQESRRMVGLEPLQPIASIPAKGAMTECL